MSKERGQKNEPMFQRKKESKNGANLDNFDFADIRLNQVVVLRTISGNIYRIEATRKGLVFVNERMNNKQSAPLYLIPREKGQIILKSGVPFHYKAQSEDGSNILGETTDIQSIQLVGSNERIKEEEVDKLDIRDILSRPQSMEKKPATNILGSQLDKSYAELNTNHPDITRQRKVLSLTMRFFDVAMYMRISEQAMFGPKKYERTDNPDELEPIMKDIRLSLKQAEDAVASNPNNHKPQHENLWLYVTRGTKFKTAYRIYLSPKSEETGRVFRALDRTIDPTTNFQMKTLDYRGLNPLEAGRIDKIIIYASEENVDDIYRAVQEVYNQERDCFEGRIAPGGGLATPFEGISVALQPEKKEGIEITGTMNSANEIDERLKQRSEKVVLERFAKFKGNPRKIAENDEGKFLSSFIRILVKETSFLLGKLPDDVVIELKECLTVALYGNIAVSLSNNHDISLSKIKSDFIIAIRKNKKIMLDNTQKNKILSANGLDNYYFGDIEKIIKNSIKHTGFALAIDNGLQLGISPAESFRNLIKD